MFALLVRQGARSHARANARGKDTPRGDAKSLPRQPETATVVVMNPQPISPMKYLAVYSFIAVAMLTIAGCRSREEKAHKLFMQRNYFEILMNYSDLPVARLAKNKLAEVLLTEGKYHEILADFGDTPSAAEATNRIAEKLASMHLDRRGYYDDGRFVQFPKWYIPPGNYSAALAQEMLWRNGFLGELIVRYPESPLGIRARAAWAESEWERIKKLDSTAQLAAVERYVQDSAYFDSIHVQYAYQELAKLRNAVSVKK
jgi:hypothetical protein